MIASPTATPYRIRASAEEHHPPPACAGSRELATSKPSCPSSGTRQSDANLEAGLTIFARDFAAHARDQTAHEREPDPRAGLTARELVLRAIERFEDRRELTLVHSLPLVGHRDPDPAVVTRKAAH